MAAVSALASIRAELGSLDWVAQIVSVRGVVNATVDFAAQTQVIDGASQTLLDLFGEDAGRHARLAVGVGSLPVLARRQIRAPDTRIRLLADRRNSERPERDQSSAEISARCSSAALRHDDA